MKLKLISILVVMLSLTIACTHGEERVKKVPVKGKTSSYLHQFMSLIQPKRCERAQLHSFEDLRKMLEDKSVHMNPVVISKIMTTLKCAEEQNTSHNHILTVIDYSLPSNEKRLWVFDLSENRMLYHTHVSHGIASGHLFTEQFSNKYNSKASSIGVYRTDDSYYGRHGLSVRLTGLEPGFNDHASGRSVVIHSAWYMNENFIKKYGRPGRSWGCPAISREMKEPVINAIKNNALLVVYYPGEEWVSKSRYLNCNRFSALKQVELHDTELKEPSEKRTDVLFVEKTHHNKREDSDPIMVMSADNYLSTFHTQVPLLRMLRCRIHDAEYVALSDAEFETLVNSGDAEAFKDISFVVPEIKNVRGYYKTEMRFVQLGKIQHVSIHPDIQKYTVTFDKSPPALLKKNHDFIRWLGL